MSRVCLGMGAVGEQTDESMALEIRGKATDAGVNFIDTNDVHPAGGTSWPNDQGTVDK